MSRTSPSNTILPKNRFCYFCTNAITDIDYRDTQLIQRFLSSYMKVVPRKRTGTCLAHQRRLSDAIKRARFLALIPYTVR